MRCLQWRKKVLDSVDSVFESQRVDGSDAPIPNVNAPERSGSVLDAPSPLIWMRPPRVKKERAILYCAHAMALWAGATLGTLP